MLQLHILVLMEIVLFCCVIMDIFANLPIQNFISTVYKCRWCCKKMLPKSDL